MPRMRVDLFGTAQAPSCIGKPWVGLAFLCTAVRQQKRETLPKDINRLLAAHETPLTELCLGRPTPLPLAVTRPSPQRPLLRQSRRCQLPQLLHDRTLLLQQCQPLNRRWRRLSLQQRCRLSLVLLDQQCRRR